MLPVALPAREDDRQNETYSAGLTLDVDRRVADDFVCSPRLVLRRDHLKAIGHEQRNDPAVT